MRSVVRLVARAAGSCCLVLATACAPVETGGSTTPTLDRALVSAADLPSGFTPATPDPPVASESDRPECTGTLDGLEVEPIGDAGVHERRVYLRNPASTAVQHVVRQFPDSARAAAALTQARVVLSTCARFGVRYPRDGLDLVESVTPVRPPGTTSVAWAARETVSGPGTELTSTIVLLQRGPRLSVVSVFTPFGPDPDLVAAAVAAADGRMSA